MQPVNGFYGHIQRNNMRSVVMFLGFVLACQLIGIAVLIGPLMLFDLEHMPVKDFSAYMQRYGGFVFAGTLLLFAVRFFLHVKHVKQDMNFHVVSRIEEQRLHKIIEIQAIGAGIAMPQVGIIEDDALNAFACGMSKQSAVVVVTRGLLRALDDEELEAVVAHEITHIINGDIRMLAVANVMLSTLLLVKKNNPIRIEDAKQIFIILVLPPFLILFLASGFITSVAMTLGMLSRLLIASSREFVADAEAVRMTKNPAALISALRTIEGRSEIDGLDETHDAMMIDGAVEGAYASHPTIAERIAVLTQHAGAMALGPRTRKDTRTLAELGAGTDGAFGRRVQPATMNVDAPKKRLIDRVNTGSNVNAFGLTPKMRNLAILAVLVPAVYTGLSMHAVKSHLLDMQGLREKMNAPLNQLGFDGVVAHNSKNQPMSQRARVGKLRKMNPLEARCFAGDRYSIGDRELHTFKTPKRGLVAEYVNGSKRTSDIKVEKYAAAHIKSNRAVHRAVDRKELNKALSQYVAQRKSLLVVMHRFFDDAGFEWMRETYESASDKNVIKEIILRLDDGGKIGRNKRAASEIALLIDNSKDFIPCFARDRIEQAKKAGSAAVTLETSQASTNISAQ